MSNSSALLPSAGLTAKCFTSKSNSVRLALMVGMLCLLFWPHNSSAQNIQHTQNKPDSTLRSDLRIDPATLGMSLQIPLATYPGRGGTSVPLGLNYNSKVWRIEFGGYVNGNMANCFNPPEIEVGIECYSTTLPRFAEKSTAGWTFSSPMPTLEWLGERYDINGQPIVDPNLGFYIARLTIRFPDGSTHEVRKSDAKLSGADPLTGTYYSVDSARMKFVGTSPGAGTLYLPDGSRYVFADWSATQYIDRNGNFINGQQDTLGRQLIAPSFHNGFAHVENRSIPGFGGAPLNFSFDLRELGSTGMREPDMLTGVVPALHRMADQDTFGNNVYSPSLFSSEPGTRVTGSGFFNPVLLYRFTLPNGTAYTFTYNEYGEIAKVVYPTGGYERFRYGVIPTLSTLYSPYSQANRGVVERRISANGTGSDEVVWHYSGGGTMVTTTAPNGTTTVRYLHSGYTFGTVVFGFDDPRAGMVYDERVYAGGAMLQRTLTEWGYSGPTSDGQDSAKRNPKVMKQVEILLDTGGDALASMTTFEHDGDLNVISTTQYDYDAINSNTAQNGAIGTIAQDIAQSTPLRTSEATYLVNDPLIDSEIQAAYRARNLLSLLSSARTKNSQGTIVAEERVRYDETPLLPYGPVSGWTDPGTNLRGLPTSRGHKLLASSTWIETSTEYDQFGNVRNSWDANDTKDTSVSNPTQIEYSSTDNYAYPTRVISADPDGGGPKASLITTPTYDFTSGLVTATRDANEKTTTMEYAVTDVLGNANPLQRLTKINQPDGGWTAYGYSDTPGAVSVLTRTALDASRHIETTQQFDGLGRPWRSVKSEDATSIYTDVQYDSMGRVWQSSNPYRTGEIVRWTITAFDGLGRVTSVTTTPDNAIVSTAYSGNRILVTDQALKQRLSETDALGHLRDIWEVRTADAATESISFPGHGEVVAGYHTNYEYDPLDDLTKVTQGTQMPRTFVYDSLKRLTFASNPESGPVSYQYDDNGNLLVKTDARGVSTHFRYDALNRPTRRWYNGSSSLSETSHDTPALPAGVGASHEVNYSYDAPGVNNNSKGRLSSLTSSVSSYSYGAYDALGRVLNGTQTIDGEVYPMNYGYDLAGNLKTQTYPSGRVVTSEYDAAGRLAGVKNQASGLYYAGGAATDSTNRLQYAAHGAPSQMRLGNGLWEHTNFNTRLQPTQIGLGTSNTNSSVLQLDYGYGTTANNGNVLSQTITVPTVAGVTGYTATQAFTYDKLNRLATAQENTGTSWTQNFSYDRYGNRNFATGTTLPAALTVSNNPIINPANNRIEPAASGQTSYSYDGTGSLTHDAAGHALGYDAENKITTYDGGATSSGGATYSYDGDGRRVKKVVGGPTIVTTVFVYNVAGQLVAEYSNATPSGTGGTSYLTSDTLGSPRVITGASQGVKARHDYLPFGEEIGGPQVALVGGRTTTQGYTGDNVRQKFTSKERDNETGLDYLGARYYGSTQGRFTSTDPIPVTKESFLNPQRWNLYVYVNNNPLVAVDPNGADGQGKGGDKIISVFLDYGVKDLGRRVTTVDGKVTRDVPNTSDWQGTRSGAPSGYQVELFGHSDVTGNKGLPQVVSDRAFNNALKSSDVVIYVGHGRGDPGSVPFQQEGIQVGATYYTPTGTGSAYPSAVAGPGPFTGPKPQTGASVVVNLSCDADRNAGAYFEFTGENQIMVTLNSRGDGLNGGITSFDALDKAANAFVKTYVTTGGDLTQATAAANAVLATIPGDQNQNVGDEIRRRKAN